MRDIGLHLRLTESIDKLIEHAVKLNLPLFQCFFILERSGHFVRLSNKQVKSFIALRRAYFKQIFLHGSFWINLSSIFCHDHKALQRELTLAKRLEFSHIILHPGSAKGAQDRIEGIDALARSLNNLLKNEKDIQIVLENIAHGNMSVGGDLHDFQLLMQKIDFPDKLQFCIDTTHAYSFGYDISKRNEQDKFITEIEKTIGLDRIALIHLNDTKEACGSKIDRHCLIGEGNIGINALKRFVLDKRLAHIPVLMELPLILEQHKTNVLKEVRRWHE